MLRLGCVCQQGAGSTGCYLVSVGPDFQTAMLALPWQLHQSQHRERLWLLLACKPDEAAAAWQALQAVARCLQRWTVLAGLVGLDGAHRCPPCRDGMSRKVT